MLKMKSEWSSSKYKRYIKEGRGQGVGQYYKPWVKTSDYASTGRASRIHGVKTGRIHHLHSDNQLRAFLIFEFSDQIQVVDIRESYPLLDVMEVIDNKDNLRFDKFCDKETGEPLVICTNFLLTVKDTAGNEKLVARTVKNTSELSKKITLEKLEIERRYWKYKGIEWNIITEKQISRQLCKNIEWVRETLLDDGIIEKSSLAKRLLVYLLSNLTLNIKRLLKEFDEAEELVAGTALYLFRYLIATKQIKINMNEKVNLNQQVKDILL